MYITNFQHFLDEEGKIPKEIPPKARELANFMALIVDAATSSQDRVGRTGLKCNSEGCSGDVYFIVNPQESICWGCVDCPNEGVISGWQNTNWDNRSK